MRPGEAIIAANRFPGPLTLFVSRRKRLIALAVFVLIAALFTYFTLVDAGPEYRSYDWIMVPVVALVCGALAIRSVLLLVWPRSASLTLDADGFTIGHVFWRTRYAWADADNFRLSEDKIHVVFDDGAGTHPLPDNYAMKTVELARLMTMWRERALPDFPREEG